MKGKADSTPCLLRAALFSVLAGACTTIAPEQYDPFVLPEEQVLNAIDAVVLTPLTVPADLHVSSSASRRIDSLIEAEFGAVGIEVVPAAVYAQIWDRILRQTGGFFDPITGERNDTKFQKARQELLHELGGRFGTQVMLYSELQIVEAVVTEGVAEWDGTSQRVTGPDSRIVEQFRETFVEDAFGGGQYGTVGAVSLVLAIEGALGEEIYRNFGGVEVLSTGGIGRGTAEFELIADEARVTYAVGIVVGPLSKNKQAANQR